MTTARALGRGRRQGGHAGADRRAHTFGPRRIERDLDVEAFELTLAAFNLRPQDDDDGPAGRRERLLDAVTEQRASLIPEQLLRPSLPEPRRRAGRQDDGRDEPAKPSRRRYRQAAAKCPYLEECQSWALQAGGGTPYRMVSRYASEPRAARQGTTQQRRMPAACGRGPATLPVRLQSWGACRQITGGSPSSCVRS